MKSVVITGSARGLGFEMAKEFYKNNFNVVLSDVNDDMLKEALNKITNEVQSSAKIVSIKCDVTKENDLNNLLNKCISEFESVDIWINNAGVNQPNEAPWDIDSDTINKILDIDLRGTVMGTNIAARQMIKQGFGQIYFIEGYGSNDAMMPGLTVYGTSKRALTYYYMSLAKEIENKNLPIKIGRLSPGIMITDFITNSVNSKIKLDEKTKKVYNVLGDYPDVIAKFLVNKMINNTKNNAYFNWLTTGKASLRFMLSAFNKRNFFESEK